MRAALTGLAKRRLLDVAEARMAQEPVVVLNGPRTVGKSTLLSQLGAQLGLSVIDCDDPATRSAVRDDPARFVESDRLVLIDEYQHVPALLDAIKAQLNRDLRRIDSGDLRGLRQLKDRLGTRLQEAIVLYTGVHAYSRDDWIRVLPLDRLWASGDAQERLGH
jgi:hypothetical protein